MRLFVRSRRAERGCVVRCVRRAERRVHRALVPACVVRSRACVVRSVCCEERASCGAEGAPCVGAECRACVCAAGLVLFIMIYSDHLSQI